MHVGRIDGRYRANLLSAPSLGFLFERAAVGHVRLSVVLVSCIHVDGDIELITVGSGIAAGLVRDLRAATEVKALFPVLRLAMNGCTGAGNTRDTPTRHGGVDIIWKGLLKQIKH
jgi:hypothetical protein